MAEKDQQPLHEVRPTTQAQPGDKSVNDECRMTNDELRNTSDALFDIRHSTFVIRHSSL